MYICVCVCERERSQNYCAYSQTRQWPGFDPACNTCIVMSVHSDKSKVTGHRNVAESGYLLPPSVITAACIVLLRCLCNLDQLSILLIPKSFQFQSFFSFLPLIFAHLCRFRNASKHTSELSFFFPLSLSSLCLCLALELGQKCERRDDDS